MPDPTDAKRVARVRDYYERNTPIFLRFGRERETQTIHRSVWAEGITTLPEALTYVNRLIGQAIAARMGGGPMRLLDLGCGVGGSLFHLASTMSAPFQGVGVTISPTQCRLARETARARGVVDRCAFVEASFLQLPFAGTFDVCYAVESLIHAPDLGLGFSEAARALKPGGTLLVCDDFLMDEPSGTPAWLIAFRRGWHANSALPLALAIALAEAAGLCLTYKRDLTPDLRLLRLPGPLVEAALRIGNILPADWAFIQGQIGGLALQHGLGRRLIGYHWLEFKKI